MRGCVSNRESPSPRLCQPANVPVSLLSYLEAALSISNLRGGGGFALVFVISAASRRWSSVENLGHNERGWCGGRGPVREAFRVVSQPAPCVPVKSV
jgi:hypothetical protein